RPVRGHGPQRPGRAGGQRGDREGPAAGFSAGHASMAVLTRRRVHSGSVLAEGDALQDESRLAWWLLGRQGSLVIPRLRIGASSAWHGLSVIHPPSQPGFPAPDSGDRRPTPRPPRRQRGSLVVPLLRRRPSGTLPSIGKRRR